MLRGVVLRVFQYNPSIIHNLDFTLESMNSFFAKHEVHRLGFAQKHDTDSYEIGIVTSDYSGGRKPVTAARLAYVLAHEFAHIGATKFLREGGKDWFHWRKIFLKEKREGTGLVRKIVSAVHDNVWTTDAQAEYDHYMNHVDKDGNPSMNEFLAAMVGYYVVNDSLPLMADLTTAQSRDLRFADGLIKRVMNYINRMMSKVGIVFSDFRKQAPAEWEATQQLIHRTMGFDNDVKLHDVGNKPTGPMYMTGPVTDTASEDATIRENVQILRNISDRLDETEQAFNAETTMREAGRGELDDVQFEDLHKAYNELLTQSTEATTTIEKAGGKQLDPWGITREKYITVLDEVQIKFKDPDSDAVDLDRVFSEGNPEELRTMASYITRALRDIYIGRDGDFTVLADSALEGLPGFSSERGAIKKILAGGTMSATGANYTWNSPFQLLVWLSTMVDSSLTTLPGHWGNMNGLPSVVTELNKISQSSEEIGTLMEVDINNELTNAIQRAAAVSSLTGRQDKALTDKRDAIAQDILQAIEGGDFKNPLVLNNEVIKKAATRIVSIYTTMMTDLLKTNEDYTGTFTEDLQTLIPWRFATGKLKTDALSEIGNFRSELGGLINANMAHNTEKIDPFEAYTAGLLPSIMDATRGLQDLKRLKDTSATQGIYQNLLELAASRQLQEDRGNMSLKDALAEIRNTATYSQKMTSTEEALKGPGGETYYNNYMIGENGYGAIGLVMQTMGSLSSKKGTMATFNILGDESVRSFRAALALTRKPHTELSAAQKNRLDELNNARTVLPESLMPRSDNKHLGITIQTPADLHVRNIINGAGVNVYFPRSWAIPPVSVAMSNSVLSEFLVSNPKELSQGIMRSMGQNIVIKNMFKEQLI